MGQLQFSIVITVVALELKNVHMGSMRNINIALIIKQLSMTDVIIIYIMKKFVTYNQCFN